MKRIIILVLVALAVVAKSAAASPVATDSATAAKVYDVHLVKQVQSSVYLPLTVKVMTDRPGVSFNLHEQGKDGQNVGPLKPTSTRRADNGQWELTLVIRHLPTLGINYNIVSPDVDYVADLPRGVVTAFHVENPIYHQSLKVNRDPRSITATAEMKISQVLPSTARIVVSIQTLRSGTWQALRRSSRASHIYDGNPSHRRVAPVIVRLQGLAARCYRVVSTYSIVTDLGTPIAHGRIVQTLASHG